jgi:tRNA threonylcarbamoyladenosine biosynthesis protein TsaB
VQGLAYALDKPVYGVSTLMAMAEGARREQGATRVISAIDARMGEVYWAAYEWQNGTWHTAIAESVTSPQQAQWPVFTDALAVGSAWPVFADALNSPMTLTLQQEPSVRFPNAIDMLTIAIPAIKRGETVNAYHAEPVYLRDHVADKPAIKK